MLQEAFVQLVMEQEGDKILRTTMVWLNGWLRLKFKISAFYFAKSQLY